MSRHERPDDVPGLALPVNTVWRAYPPSWIGAPYFCRNVDALGIDWGKPDGGDLARIRLAISLEGAPT